ncbi:MAG TPA: hypothetical protein VF511_02295, partial [Chthoniobacterales bacterium]
NPEALHLKDEVKRLRDRVAVLERIATDKNHLLEQEFEKLRKKAEGAKEKVSELKETVARK